MSERAVLVLEDGSAFWGWRFGATVDAAAEVVFNTSMTGYQEICTDASYRGQMVVLTHPLIGNYGVTTGDDESRQPWVSALIVREYYRDHSNWRAEGDLDAFLMSAGVPGIFGVDTRSLTRRLRSKGTMRGILAGEVDEAALDGLVVRARAIPPIGEHDVVGETAVERSYEASAGDPGMPRIVVVDCGIKQNIVRSLQRRRVGVVVVPPRATAGEILALRPGGVVVSNGPGDPAAVPHVARSVRGLVEVGIPLLGICLGHQLLGLAIGATTSRLKFGHHGGNHPVKDLSTGEVHITSQNHEYQVDAPAVPAASGFAVSQVNINDRSVEGLAHASKPIFSVQYHPEGSPGPQDNPYLFDRFLRAASQSGALQT
ncbi:MAG: glutamine-hydrolyzing carbamoyl-phosphate synthase small subunit [Chloroflexi bacterium]|nr:glutamine-hydrolyzing carbamoyl-phosphate synthase small subunit [Chloroflexota bacterium]